MKFVMHMKCSPANSSVRRMISLGMQGLKALAAVRVDIPDLRVRHSIWVILVIFLGHSLAGGWGISDSILAVALVGV